MNIGGGSLFDLQATLTVDTGTFESDIQSAIDTAEELADALNEDMSVSVDVDVDGEDEVERLADDIGSIEDAEANVIANVDGEEEVDSLSDNIDSLEDTDVDVTANVDGAGDVDALNDALADVSSNAGSAGGSMSELGSTIKSALGAAGALGAVTALSKGVNDLVTGFAGGGDAIDKKSQMYFGESSSAARQAYQEWDYVFSQSGTSMDESGRVFKTLANSMQDGSKKFKGALKEVGLSYDDLKGMDAASQFDAIVKALQGMPDGSEKAALAMDLLGGSAQKLMPLLNGSADDTDALREAAHALGLVMSDEEIDNAVKYTDAMDTLNRTIEGLKSDAVNTFISAITEFATAMSSLIGMFTGEDNSLSGKIDAITSSFSGMIGAIDGKEQTINAIIDAMDALGDPTTLSDADLAVYQSLYEQLLSIAPGLASQFGTVADATAGFTDKLRENTEELMNNAREQALAQAAQERMQAVVDAQSEAYDKKAQAAIASQKADNAMSDAQKATQKYMELATQQQQEYAKGFLDDNGILDYAAMMQSLGEAMSTQEVGLDQSSVEAMTGYATAAQEAASAQAAFNEAQAAVDAANANYDQWYSAMQQIVAGETQAATSAASLATESESASVSLSGIATAVSAITDNVSGAVEAMGGFDDVGSSTDNASRKMTSFSSRVKSSMATAKTSVASAVSSIQSKLDSLKDKTITITTVQKTRTDNSGNAYNNALSMSERMAVSNAGTAAPRDIDINALANAIADAVARRPMALYVGARELAVATSTETTRQTAIRTNQVSSGYGMGAY